MTTNDMKLKDYLIDVGSPVALPIFIPLSIAITELVYREHQQTAVIGYLNPANIRLESETPAKQVRLSAYMDWDEVYQSPEQTGLLNLQINGRSDLYSLGVIFYVMLTGTTPFQPEEGDSWAVAHIRMPPAAWTSSSDALQSIIMKLLAKSPDDRYQSAYGLLDDLRQCERMLVDDDKMHAFEIGRLDRLRSFRLPDALYGNHVAIERMQAALAQAASGASVFRWLCGSAGSGKSELVQKLREDIAAVGGRLVAGVGEQSRSVHPLEPLLQALRQWIDQLWSDPPETIARLQERLTAVFGQDAQTIVTVLPEARILFANLVDIQAKQRPTSDADSWVRFGRLLPALIRALVNYGSPRTHGRAVPEGNDQPVVLFIDQIQFADEHTLDAIQIMVRNRGIPGLFVIGAIRTEHVERVPWLADRLRTNPDEWVDLHPWTYEDIRQYVVDAVQEDSARVRLLARSLHLLTDGNPHALRLRLEDWVRDKKLVFDDTQRRWTWETEIARLTEDLQAKRERLEIDFAMLTDEAKGLLATAAAMGLTFRLTVLCACTDLQPDEVLRHFDAAEALGIVCWEDEPDLYSKSDRMYMFMHDHLHHLAYTYDAAGNAQRHLKIGQYLLRDYRNAMDSERLRTAVDHLNRGRAELSASERKQLASYNAQVGQQFGQERRFDKGQAYMEVGLELVDGDDEPLFYQLKRAAVEFAYMSGNTEQSKQHLLDMDQLGERLHRADRAWVWNKLLEMNSFVENETAINYGKQALEAYGWHLREKPSKLVVLREIIHTLGHMRSKQARRITLASPHDEDYMALCESVELIMFQLAMHDGNALIDLYARFIRYGLGKGLNASLLSIMCVYELLMQRGLKSRYTGANPLARLRTIGDAMDYDPKYQHTIDFTVGMFQQLDHPASAYLHMERALRGALEMDRVTVANVDMILCLVTYNHDLNALSNLLTYFDKDLKSYGASDTTLEMADIMRRYLVALRDVDALTPFVAIPSGLDDEDNVSYMCKLEVAYLSGQYREALHWAKRARENEFAMDWVRVWKHRLYETLALAAVYPEVDAVERKSIKRSMQRQLREMKRRKGYLGVDSSAYLLLNAEWARVTGDERGTWRGYTDAVQRAKEEQYALIEAIACERLAAYLQHHAKKPSAALIAAMDACTAYTLWGADAKVAQMRREYPNLQWMVTQPNEDVPAEEENRIDTASASTRTPRVYPYRSVDRRELERPDELLRQMMDWTSRSHGERSWLDHFLHIALRQAGADRGSIIRCRNDEFQLEASSDRQVHHEVSALAAMSVLRYTIMMNEAVMLHDATESHFLRDAYIREWRTKSILCLPIQVPGEDYLILLYLENRTVAGVFTERDVNVLQLLITRVVYLKMLADVSIEIAPISSDAEVLAEPLTKRELEILVAMAEGLSNQEIAERFAITERTVKKHGTSIFGKLDVKRRGQAVSRARALHIID
ncbi:LuxR C-terminal-related transcriptional regulator [Paenibacillus sp. B01]|uniref:LuxR C-terminal-related transcriptional regulator n=1 Tax=Paenibacillus sp. B01 TaxID=2660554 RepID=UPI002B269575|nr:LuxR C-terminal-related transcriptional regulator [Paenibacillus sp. B01]